MALIRFPQREVTELQYYINRRDYLRAYNLMKRCYEILHKLNPEVLGFQTLQNHIIDLDVAIDSFLFGDRDFEVYLDCFINWCQSCGVIISVRFPW